MHATDSFIINGLEERRKHKSPEIDVVTCGRFVVPEQRSAPSSITFSTAGKLEKANVRLISTLFPFHCLVFHPLFSKEQRSAPFSVTFSTVGKLENANMRLSSILFPGDCLALYFLFSKEQMFSEHCTFETSPDVKLVTGEENVISIFQDVTGFENVT